MYCDSCGTENRDGANYCYHCGKDLSHIVASQDGGAEAEVDAAPPEPVVPPVPIVEETPSTDWVSRVLGGRYEVKEMLGGGGMGTVYHAYDGHLGMDVAIKFLANDVANDPRAIDQLKREAKAAMRLAHSNIIRLYNFEDTPAAKYLLMEYVEGDSLASLASRRPDRRFSESEVIKYASPICEALRYAHDEGIIHRDIKPSNILVSTNGHVKLSDFGIAYIIEAVVEELDGGGTPIYMSPEQILGKDIDARTDIYSLGVTMYEMLAGFPPFRGRDVREQHVRTTPEPIKDVSEWMNVVVLKCLRKEADGRWLDAGELKDVLERKKEIGVAMDSKYKPWWLRGDVAPPINESRTPMPEAPRRSPGPPENLYVAVQRTSPSARSAQVRSRVSKLEQFANLKEHVPEREHRRMSLGAFAGVLGAGILTTIGSAADWSIPDGNLFQLSWILCGGLIGLAVGLSQKSGVKAALSLSFGVAGGTAVLLLLSTAVGPSVAEYWRPYFYTVLSAVILCGSLGIADGLYENSVLYALHCFVWGAIGGVIAVAVFWGLREIFSVFWHPLLNGVIMGGLLGFFFNMFVGFARTPWSKARN